MLVAAASRLRIPPNILLYLKTLPCGNCWLSYLPFQDLPALATQLNSCTFFSLDGKKSCPTGMHLSIIFRSRPLSRFFLWSQAFMSFFLKKTCSLVLVENYFYSSKTILSGFQYPSDLHLCCFSKCKSSFRIYYSLTPSNIPLSPRSHPEV